jgi:hypothetical protein
MSTQTGHLAASAGRGSRIVDSTLYEFESLIRRYAAGNIEWDAVHQCMVQIECENRVDFPPIYEALGELHTMFLIANSKDDPQFRTDIAPTIALLSGLDANRQFIAGDGPKAKTSPASPD